MDYKLEVVVVPVSDVDRAKRFYAEQVGFVVDVDHQPNEHFRVVQLTPPGSGCSVTIGKGIADMEPGSLKGLQLSVADIEAARAELAVAGRAGEHDPAPRRQRVRRGQGRRLQLVHVLRRPGRQRLGHPGEPDGFGRRSKRPRPPLREPRLMVAKLASTPPREPPRPRSTPPQRATGRAADAAPASPGDDRRGSARGRRDHQLRGAGVPLPRTGARRVHRCEGPLLAVPDERSRPRRPSAPSSPGSARPRARSGSHRRTRSPTSSSRRSSGHAWPRSRRRRSRADTASPSSPSTLRTIGLSVAGRVRMRTATRADLTDRP